MENTPRDIGIRLREIRDRALLSQNQMADAMNEIARKYGKKIGRNAISNWERGLVKEISASNLLIAAKVLAANPYWIVFGEY